jgi:hypothetical protein
VTAQSTLRNPFGLGTGPLARREARQLAGGSPPRPPSIPFSEFVPSSHPEAALALAAEQYASLARGERSAIGLFARIATALDAQALSPEFVLAATAASHDEARHAVYCEELAVRCGAAPFASGRESSAGAPSSEPALSTLAELDVTLLKAVAISETLAAALLMACRDRARDPVVVALLGALVADEIHHARLGWYYAAERAPSWNEAERQALADVVGEAVVQIESEFWWGRDAEAAFERSAEELGVLSSVAQRQCILEVMQQEILPALDALGLSASLAWDHRRPVERASGQTPTMTSVES